MDRESILKKIRTRAQEALVLKIHNFSKQIDLTRDNCKAFICEAYEVIEDQKNNYPTLTFFRDWLSHNALDRQKALAQIDLLFELVKKSSAIIEIDFQNINLADIISEKLISFKNLRRELMEIVKSLDCVLSVLTNYDSWIQFVGVICTICLRKSIREKQSKNIESFYLEEEGKKIIWNLNLKKSKSIPHPFFRIFGYLGLDESRDEF